MNTIIGNEPAFACSAVANDDCGILVAGQPGMTKREAFAMAALQGMLSHGTRYKPRAGAPVNWHKAIAEEAAEIADALIAELAKGDTAREREARELKEQCDAFEADAARLRGGLEAIVSQCVSVRQFYERNGPTWTGKDGHEYADMSALLNVAEEFEYTARTALEGGKP